ncbi:AMP-binding protein [Sphingomonas sp. CGMCC 1.13654]|uniref:3-methylmercaptopropionyl-CoA ligase n=1 Tax=Sphingomonas chungangi TaxID=2683589 RepID=A0A838L4C8_9SPHN|nr:AMP-binding protein [Sphingomonas chungangi]MBA2933760.1 AMP-binding protein [Sphingomonas chungangi]MVW55091.1 AMP-binding protein [Sphingomonas chungangi]
MYLTQCLHRHVQQMPDAIAAVDPDAVVNWVELRDRAARFAGMLRARGLQPGDRVAMLGRNGIDFVVFILGTWWAGGVINPVNTRWTTVEMAYSLENCGTRFLFVDTVFEPLVPALAAAAPNLAQIIPTAKLYEWMAGAAPAEDALRRGGDLAAILYTGGTTGFPKGVMLSHANLAGSLLGVLAQPHGPATGAYLNVAPLFHVGSLSGLLITLYSGQASIFLPQFEPLAVLEAIERHRPGDIFLVPTMLRMLLQHPRFAEFDTGSIRQIRYGASPIDEVLMDIAIAAFPRARFNQSYGMTELGPVASTLAPEDHEPAARINGHLRSAGRATPTCELRIVGPDDRELPRGEIGEIVARGQGVMLGYWDLPELTAEALRGGWMHTGDMGRMDEAGYVTVVDRLKDMIVTGGENVYSAEVESALAGHDDVAAVAVIAAPDPRWGERVHAVIVPRAGRRPGEAALIAHCRDHIAGYKLPRSFEFVDALPLSAAGKVQKNVLRDRLRAEAQAITPLARSAAIRSAE